jgi:hypothetical protein
MLKLDQNDDSNDTQTRKEIFRLNNAVLKHGNEFGLKSFTTTRVAQSSKDEHTPTGDADGGAGAGAANTGAFVELKAHGYEVKPEVIVDLSGVVIEPLSTGRAWQLFLTYHTSRCFPTPRCRPI